MTGTEFSTDNGEGMTNGHSKQQPSDGNPDGGFRGGRGGGYRSNEYRPKSHFHHQNNPQQRNYQQRFAPYEKQQHGYGNQQQQSGRGMRPSAHHQRPPYADDDDVAATSAASGHQQQPRWENTGHRKSHYDQPSYGYDTADNQRNFSRSSSTRFDSQSSHQKQDSHSMETDNAENPAEKTPTLFFGNLAYSISKDDLTEMLSAISPVVHISMPLDRETGNSRGFAFVEFETFEGAEAVLNEMLGKELHGRSIRVDWGEARGRRREREAGTDDGKYSRDREDDVKYARSEEGADNYPPSRDDRSYGGRSQGAPVDSYAPSEYRRGGNYRNGPREFSDYRGAPPAPYQPSHHDSYEARDAGPPPRKPVHVDSYRGNQDRPPYQDSYRGDRGHRQGGMAAAAAYQDDYGHRPGRYQDQPYPDRPPYAGDRDDRRSYPPHRQQQQSHYAPQGGRGQYNEGGYHQRYNENRYDDRPRYSEHHRPPPPPQQPGYQTSHYREQNNRDDSRGAQPRYNDHASSGGYQPRPYHQRQPYNENRYQGGNHYQQRGGGGYHRGGGRRQYYDQQQRRRSQSPVGDRVNQASAAAADPNNNATADVQATPDGWYTEYPDQQQQPSEQAAAAAAANEDAATTEQPPYYQSSHHHEELLEGLTPGNVDAPLVVDEQADNMASKQQQQGGHDSPDIDN